MKSSKRRVKMNENNLEKYCRDQSISVACRVCNMIASSKEDMTLVSPTDGTYGNLHYCKLSKITQESCEIFLCETCRSVIYRCAYGIYQLKYGFILHGQTDTPCRICKSSLSIHQLNIEENTEKNEVLIELVGDSVEMPVWICKACEDIFQDLFELHQTVTNTTLEIQATLESKTTLHDEERSTSKPIGILNPRPKLPVFQSSRDSYGNEAKNVKNLFLPRASLLEDVCLFSSKDVDDYIFPFEDEDAKTATNKSNVTHVNVSGLWTNNAAAVDGDLNKINNRKSCNTSEKHKSLQEHILQNKTDFIKEDIGDEGFDPFENLASWSLLDNGSETEDNLYSISKFSLMDSQSQIDFDVNFVKMPKNLWSKVSNSSIPR